MLSRILKINIKLIILISCAFVVYSCSHRLEDLSPDVSQDSWVDYFGDSAIYNIYDFDPLNPDSLILVDVDTICILKSRLNDYVDDGAFLNPTINVYYLGSTKCDFSKSGFLEYSTVSYNTYYPGFEIDTFAIKLKDSSVPFMVDINDSLMGIISEKDNVTLSNDSTYSFCLKLEYIADTINNLDTTKYPFRRIYFGLDRGFLLIELRDYRRIEFGGFYNTEEDESDVSN